jgi:hypothetical protein
MKDLSLKFGGTLIVEEYEYNNREREDKNIIYIFDSSGSRLTYFEVETVESAASVENILPEEWLELYYLKVQDCESIEALLAFLDIPYWAASKNWDAIRESLLSLAKQRDETTEGGGYTLKFIGDYYIHLAD